MNHASRAIGCGDFSKYEVRTLTESHAALGPQRTVAQYLLISGSTNLLHAGMQLVSLFLSRAMLLRTCEWQQAGLR